MLTVSSVTHIYGTQSGNLAVNCRISGDKVENTIWRAENLTLPSGIKYAMIICGTNNIDYNESWFTMCGIDTGFKISPKSDNIGRTTEGLC